ncbi:MAG TPA: hypothetical protein VMR96_00540 [Solirubrobacterales bacterium]|nr:hypothetical protein [Solirubrobacterales bacterium]
MAAGLTVAMAGLAFAAYYEPTVVRAGDLVISVNGRISPAALPKSKVAPIEASAQGTVATTSGSHPPAARSVVVRIDRSFAIDAKGLPACKPGQLIASSTAVAKRACPNAIVGTGSAEAEVAFPEQAPFKARGPLLFFNGGSNGNSTLLLVHLYAAVPAPTAIVTTVKIAKTHRGRYGYQAVAQIPVIAGGSGSIVGFNFDIDRKFTDGGKRRSYLAAKCPTGRYLTQIQASFADGASLQGTVARSCTPKG